MICALCQTAFERKEGRGRTPKYCSTRCKNRASLGQAAENRPKQAFVYDARLDRPARNDDAALVAAYQAGDDSAFTAIYERYAPRLLAFAYLRCKDADYAQDLVQEAMLKAARYIPHGEIHGLNGYLILCVKQTWWMRGRQAERRPDETPFDPTYHGGYGFVDDLVCERETVQEVATLLDCLPEYDRDVALLKVLYDFDLESAAAHLGRSKSSAATAWRRCTRKFVAWAGTKQHYDALDQALILARYPDIAPIEDQCRVPGCARPRHAYERCEYHAESMLARRRQLAEKRQEHAHGDTAHA